MNVPAESRLPIGVSHRGRRAFTLVELLVVMAVIVVLIGLVVPAIMTMTRGSQLTQSAQLLDDQLNLARQLALAKNMTVEVRFYRFADPSIPGESAGSAASGKFRAFQFFTIKDSGQQAVAMGKVQRLQPAIIIDSGSALSSLLDTATNPTLAKTQWTSADPQISLPNIGTSYQCCTFRYLPNGTTNLTTLSGSNFFLTLHSIKDGDARSAPPADFLTVQIDAAGGHLRTFHP